MSNPWTDAKLPYHDLDRRWRGRKRRPSQLIRRDISVLLLLLLQLKDVNNGLLKIKTGNSLINFVIISPPTLSLRKRIEKERGWRKANLFNDSNKNNLGPGTEQEGQGRRTRSHLEIRLSWLWYYYFMATENRQMRRRRMGRKLLSLSWLSIATSREWRKKEKVCPADNGQMMDACWWRTLVGLLRDDDDRD